MKEILTSKHFPDSFHRVAIKGLVVREAKILLLKESEELGGSWELPGGGLDFGEEMHLALRREVHEETSLIVTNITQKPVYTWSTRFENRRGMDWFYSLVVAYGMELESLDFQSSKECVDIGFFSKEELMTVPLSLQSAALMTMFNPSDFE